MASESVLVICKVLKSNKIYNVWYDQVKVFKVILKLPKQLCPKWNNLGMPANDVNAPFSSDLGNEQ